MRVTRIFHFTKAVIFTAFLGMLAEPVSAISRVGNARFGSEADGFSFAMPRSFRYRGISESEILYLETTRRVFRPRVGPGYSQRISMRVENFTTSFSDFVDYSRNEFQDFLLGVEGTEWTLVESSDHDFPECLDIFWATGESSLGILLRWGPDAGMVAVSEDNAQVERAFLQILESFELDEEFCGWQ